MRTQTLSRPRAPRHRRPAAVAILLSLGLLPPAAAQAPADAVLQGFQPTGDYLLSVAGEEVPKAEIYASQRAGAILIMSSAFESPVLLSPRNGSVETVDLMKVVKRDDGSVDLLANATLRPQGGFRLDGEEILFAVGGTSARLRPKPPLVGSHPRSDLVAHSPEYLRAGASYRPDPQALSRLRQTSQPVRVRVFFGSWCSVCKRYLPHVLKLEDELEGSRIDFDYYGLARPPEGWNDPEVKRLGITGVPTGIVYVGGREAGRIAGTTAWAQVETTLGSIIRGADGAGGR